MLGSKIFFIATGVPLSRPLWMTEKPPWPIYSPISISLMLISRTPATGGSLPDVVDTSEAPYVKEAKFALTSSFLIDSIWSLSSLFYRFSSFNWFSRCAARALLAAVVGRSIGALDWLEAKFIQSRSPLPLPPEAAAPSMGEVSE